MLKTESQKNVLITGWLLALAALVGTSLMVAVNWHSKPYIAENERQVLLRSLNSVISPDTYTNNILNDVLTVHDQALLGSKEATLIYRARIDTKPVAAALTVIAPNGYSGNIYLLVGIDFNGQITGVRAVKHRETPGLGDAIESQRSNWIESFTKKSLTNPGESGWKVKRDGGDFDQFTGATITPRAVVGAVHKALIYFKKNRKLIFTSPSVINASNK